MIGSKDARTFLDQGSRLPDASIFSASRPIKYGTYLRLGTALALASLTTLSLDVNIQGRCNLLSPGLQFRGLRGSDHLGMFSPRVSNLRALTCQIRQASRTCKAVADASALRIVRVIMTCPPSRPFFTHIVCLDRSRFVRQRKPRPQQLASRPLSNIFGCTILPTSSSEPRCY